MSTAMDPPPSRELVSSNVTRHIEEIHDPIVSENFSVTPSQHSLFSLQSGAFQLEESLNVSTMKTSMDRPSPLESSDPIISSTARSPSCPQSVEERVSNLASSEASASSPSLSDTQNSSQPYDASEIDNSVDVAQEKLQASIPYRIPQWSEPPCHPFYLEVLKEGSIIDQLNICEKGAYMFGRADLCDFVLEHPTISRFHAVIQFRSSGAYLYDLGSTHGTFVNKREIKKRDYVELHVGNIIRFGLSSRLYIFQGPADLMQPEGDLNSIRSSKAQKEMEDREASLSRARREASLADGISWGMQEDAVVESEDIASELTWQTYKGHLTEKQEKTREKVIKRYEKIANMKKEIDAIRAKDIAQGGLTQGQQTQIARNEQRISQIMEELENLEETLNDSIQESVGARSGKTSRAKKAGPIEEEEEFLSDDDEFFDRAKKPLVRKNAESHSIETADTLLDKRDDIIKEIEEKKQLLLVENCRLESETENKAVTDELDEYMSAVSSQLEHDKTKRLEKEVSTLQSELDRIIYLLKFADPTGEAAKRRLSARLSVHVQNSHPVEAESHSSQLKPLLTKSEMLQKGKERISETKPNDPKQKIPITATETKSEPIIEKVALVGTSTIYTLPKPQWLGAVASNAMEELSHRQEPSSQIEHDNFIDYKDRKKILDEGDKSQLVDSTLENAAPGLIIRKKMQVEETDGTGVRGTGESTISEAQTSAEDAVALLLKHKRGVCGLDDGDELDESGSVGHPSDKRAKKIRGPAKPSFMEVESEYESWVPPKGQTGDGRTSLNERYGY